MFIKKGDNVIVISGAHKGKTGKVHQMLRERELVVVEGVNLRKKHERARRANQKGQMIEKAMPIHLSNVALVESGKAVRTGVKRAGEKWGRGRREAGKQI